MNKNKRNNRKLTKPVETNQTGIVLLGLLFCLCLSFSSNADLLDVPVVSRWNSPDNTPKSVHAVPIYNSSTKLAFAGNNATADTTNERICIVVSETVYQDAKQAITTFQNDLVNEGYAPVLLLWETGTPEDLREQLASLYSEPASLAGAILIGDIPYIIYELMQDWDGPEGKPAVYEDFPCDIFYMDLDGNWEDSTENAQVHANNGKYDMHSGMADLEIWVSRIKTDTLTSLGLESGIVVSYFDKNHRYRKHLLRPSLNALVYNDDDWSTLADNDALNAASIYDLRNTAVFSERELTTARDYMLNRATGAFEFISLRSHGFSGGHGFYQDNRTQLSYVTADDYLQLDLRALFYSLYVCSGCDFTHNGYLGGMITFSKQDAGLVAWGSTKTGGMFEESLFFAALANDAPFGPAFVEWFNQMQALDLPAFVQPWFYGMVILGDGTLKPRTHGLPLARMYEPNTGADYSVYAGSHCTNFSGTVTDVPDKLFWTNILTGASGVLPPSRTFSFSTELITGINTVHVYAITSDATNMCSLTVNVYPSGADSAGDVVALWPELIGATQTGTLEFTATRNGSYILYAGNPGNQTVIASGLCSEGYNCIAVYGGDLPALSCDLYLQINAGLPFVAGHITRVHDLSVNPAVLTPDLDGDAIRIVYKSSSGGTIHSQGRTLYISGGAATDKLIVQTGSKTLSSDGAARICGIFSDAGIAVVRIQGSLDRFHADGDVGTIKIKNGSLGWNARSGQEQVMFGSSRGNARIKITNGSLLADILCGRGPEDTDPLKTIIVKGGNIGMEGKPGRLVADSLTSCIVKHNKHGDGGSIIDYSLFLRDQISSGKGESIQYMAADMIRESNPAKPTTFVCGYEPETDPRSVQTWNAYEAGFTIGKLIVREYQFDGTFVIRSIPEKSTVPVINNAVWIVNGITH